MDEVIWPDIDNSTEASEDGDEALNSTAATLMVGRFFAGKQSVSPKVG